MHVQEGVPNWLAGVSLLPQGGLVLAVDQGGALRESKRLNPAIVTAHRHFLQGQPISGDYPTAAANARAYFRATIDGTYLRQYASLVDFVLEYNEYFDEGMANNDPDKIVERIVQATAFANVWNDEYRGRTVRSADGGEGTIPPTCRLVIGNSPVGNNIPRAFAELAIRTDNVLGYHPYMRASVRIWPDTIRDPGDWRWHSGRWNFMEQAWGLRPKWLFTEMMPYMGSTEGWRHWVVLEGDEDLLVRLYGLWLADLATTDAFKTGRVLGWTGAWFSIGGNWGEYLLEAPQLIRLAGAAANGPRPGLEEPMPDNNATIRAAIVDLNAAKAKLESVLPPKHTLSTLTNQLVFDLFRRAFGTAIYWSLVTAACDEARMLVDRSALYTGVAIEDMPGLTDAQKAALIAAIV